MPKAPKEPLSLDERVAAINDWCYTRGIKQQYTFFLACDRGLMDHYHRIRAVLPKRVPVADVDAPWIKSMELTMQAVNARKSAA